MNDLRSVPTLEDVARAAGVSTATVSRALNAPERVVVQTRERVLKVVEELGYTPNFAARVMAARRSYTIGAVIPTMENAIFARGIQAFQEELHSKGYTLVVSTSLYQAEIEYEQIRTLVARGADGLLLIGHDRDPAIYEYLKNQNVPVLVAWTYKENAEQPSVGFDNTLSMNTLANKVLEFGHRRIAVISGAIAGNDRIRQRIRGVKQALACYDVDPDGLIVVEASHNIEQAGNAFDKLIALTPAPTAVICANDVLATGAVLRARERGIKVPEDISITGFDDIELARVVEPALTTVHVPHRDMGRMAASELIEMVEGKTAGKSIRLEATLQLRNSLAPVKTN